MFKMVFLGDRNGSDTFKSIFEHEESDLSRYKEHVDQCCQLTGTMISILSSFENRLSKLEETVLPLKNETENLQLQQKNIEATISALDHVISYYNVADDVANTLKLGPSGPDGLDKFLIALDRLKQAQIYFEQNNVHSVELENVTSLFNSGADALNREFKELLLKYSKPVPPITLLDSISNEDDITPDDSSSVSSFGHYPDNVANDMTRIAQWLICESRDEFMNVYARIRASIIMKSVTMLRDHHRAGSGSSVQGITSSPTIKPKFQSKLEPPSSSRRTRIQNLFEKKANRMLWKASQTLVTLGPRRATIHFGENREDVVDDQEMENYLIIVMGVQKLMQIEMSLLTGIIPKQHQQKVYQIIIQETLDSIVQEGENIAARVKRCINRHDFLSVLVVFPILKHLLAMKPDFEKTIENCDYTVRNQFSTIINTLQSTGAKILDDFIESVRSDSNTSLPKDGTVYQLTSDVIFFLEQLLDYTDIIGAVLVQDPGYSNALTAILSDSSKRNPIDKNKTLLGIYIKKVLAQLNLTLLNKSDLYSDIGVKGVFRLNNCNYVLKALQRSNLLPLLMCCEPECENAYYSMIATHKKTYQQCWNKLLNYITVSDDLQFLSGKPKDKERNLLKEKFAGFNKEIEEIFKLQKGYSIPDFEFREGLKRDNKEIILPRYNSFYESYGSVPFAKNHDKYVKHTPEQVSAITDRFFDTAA